VQGHPDLVSINIEQAPMDWALPVRKEQNLRPPFRVSVVVKSSSPLSVPLKVTPHVLTEEEAHNGAPCACSCLQLTHAQLRPLLAFSPPPQTAGNGQCHLVAIEFFPVTQIAGAYLSTRRTARTTWGLKTCSSSCQRLACWQPTHQCTCSCNVGTDAESWQSMPLPAQRRQHDVPLPARRWCWPGSAAPPL
jgi:hypothetical protein